MDETKFDSNGEETSLGAVRADSREAAKVDGDAASDDSGQETTFSSLAAASTEKDEPGELSDREGGLEERTPLLGARKKGGYPYGPLFFIMAATAGQR